MKLYLNRREGSKGLIFKSTVYYLDVHIEASPEEIALIKKHKWEKKYPAQGRFVSGIVLDFAVGGMVGRKQDFQFADVNSLAHFENQVVEGARNLKQELEAAAGFTTGGPREIEL